MHASSMAGRRAAPRPTPARVTAVIHKYVFDPRAQQLRPMGSRMMATSPTRQLSARSLRWMFVTLALAASALGFEALRTSAMTSTALAADATP